MSLNSEWNTMYIFIIKGQNLHRITSPFTEIEGLKEEKISEQIIIIFNFGKVNSFVAFCFFVFFQLTGNMSNSLKLSSRCLMLVST